MVRGSTLCLIVTRALSFLRPPLVVLANPACVKHRMNDASSYSNLKMVEQSGMDHIRRSEVKLTNRLT